ncbi:hydrogenase maturation nickel metallochaperone HypA [Chloroflexota bacterium]
MHEFSITQSILNIALEKAEEAKASRVTNINLVVGELSGVVDDCVEFYFDFMSKDTIAAGASLSFSHPPVQLRCQNCSTVFSPDGVVWTCPGCQQRGIEIISGRELYIESLEVE